MSWWAEPEGDNESWRFTQPVSGSAELPTLLEANHQVVWIVHWQDVIRAVPDKTRAHLEDS